MLERRDVRQADALKDKAQDPEIHQTKQGNHWRFGKKRTTSKARTKVEHVFARIKRMPGFAKLRYRGFEKNAQKLFTVSALANLFIVRGVLHQTRSPPRPGQPQFKIGVPAGRTRRNIATRFALGFTTTGCCAACSSGRSALLSE
jgi:IS5 family transposase